MRTFSQIVLSVALGGAICGAILFFEEGLIGKAPDKEFSAMQHMQQQVTYQDPDIERLRQLTSSKPDDPLGWLALADGLVRKAADGIIPRQEAALEAIDALRQVQKLDPDNDRALLLMADISFDMKAFGKTKELYERYLEKYPDDLAVRARYASTLTFLGKPDEAKEMLEKIVADKPEDFQAHAFLTLTYAQLGDKEGAKKWGEKALALAPHQEAKDRLQGFLTSFLEGKVAMPPKNGEPKTMEDYLRSHQIVGPKIVNAQKEGNALRVAVKDFPMSAMPPFAREKFEKSIREFASKNKQTDLQTIVFIDTESGEQLGTVTLNDTASLNDVVGDKG